LESKLYFLEQNVAALGQSILIGKPGEEKRLTKIADDKKQIADLKAIILAKNCKTCIQRQQYTKIQNNIEVEWETGLGSDASPGHPPLQYPGTGNNIGITIPAENPNPAAASNKLGNSYGFFSSGHKKRDIIWNWPTPGDSVHIEGMWIWERAHLPPHTEIHPPHFIAIKRHLPVSFNPVGESAQINNDPTDKYIGTRIDVFATADGSAMWNTKGEKSFAQVVDMNRKDYVFKFKSLFQKPTATAKLSWKLLKRPGDNFPAGADPIIKEIPGEMIEVKIPWKTNAVANTAVLEKTIVLYWDDLPSKGVLAIEKPKLYEISLNSIHIVNNCDAWEATIPIIDQTIEIHHVFHSECLLYSNIGSEWICLNEFATSADDVLSNGLGDASDDATYSINQKIKTYVMPNGTQPHEPAKSYRIASAGWEKDWGNEAMGLIVDEYKRNVAEIRTALGHVFTTKAAAYGLEDDKMGETENYYTANFTGTQTYSIPSHDDEGNHNTNDVYKLNYSIKRIDP
jgi:hypothetical protein